MWFIGFIYTPSASRVSIKAGVSNFCRISSVKTASLRWQRHPATVEDVRNKPWRFIFFRVSASTGCGTIYLSAASERNKTSKNNYSLLAPAVDTDRLLLTIYPVMYFCDYCDRFCVRFTRTVLFKCAIILVISKYCFQKGFSPFLKIYFREEFTDNRSGVFKDLKNDMPSFGHVLCFISTNQID